MSTNYSNIIMQLRGYTTNYNNLTTVTNADGTTTTTNPIADLNSVMIKLNSNLGHLNDISTIDDSNYLTANLSANSTYNANTNTGIQAVKSISVDSIVQAIKDDTSTACDVDGAIEKYLEDSFGDKEEVIRSLAGVNSLPFQAVLMQDAIFDQIRSQISIQVRSKLFDESKDSTESIYSDAPGTSTDGVE